MANSLRLFTFTSLIKHSTCIIMLENKEFTKSISLEKYGIKNPNVHYQLSPEELHRVTIKKGQGVEASSGALTVNTENLPDVPQRTDLL